MLTIRLTRVGKKKQPTYRIVVQDKHKDPWGKAIEIVGHYNPRSNPKAAVVKADRVKHWMSLGAQPSPSAYNLLVDQKVIAGEKVKAAKGDKADGTKDAKPKEEKKK